MRDIRVERDFEKPGEWNVYADDDLRWLATFATRELADEYAEWKRLEA